MQHTLKYPLVILENTTTMKKMTQEHMTNPEHKGDERTHDESRTYMTRIARRLA